MTAATPHHDLIVFGATSFVGKILTRRLFEQFGAHGDLNWAAAGRSVARLEELRASLGPNAAKLPLLVADEAALRTMCLGTKAVVSTVGPYALYGETLVKVCAETGTDYCDLTGEAQWIRRMLSRYEDEARKSGARIVHSCGFDSIPSDLGVHFLQQEAIRRFGQPCCRVKMRVKAMRGGFSGGTVASIMNVLKEAAADPQLRKELANPYSLCPEGYAPQVRQPDVRFAEYDDDFKAWLAPFVMSAINTRIVQRTNALTKQAYGAGFRYDEAMLAGPGLKGRMTALGITAGLAGFMVAGAIGPGVPMAHEELVVDADALARRRGVPHDLATNSGIRDSNQSPYFKIFIRPTGTSPSQLRPIEDEFRKVVARSSRLNVYRVLLASRSRVRKLCTSVLSL